MRNITFPIVVAILALLLAAYFLGHERKLVQYDIPDLDISISVPKEFSDLTFTSIQLPGDQAVNSVGFSSVRLENSGCPSTSAPLGYLTYDMDKGGKKAGSANGGSLYYIEPDKPCGADPKLQNWQGLESALHIESKERAE
jgi:hypothetical protein